MVGSERGGSWIDGREREIERERGEGRVEGIEREGRGKIGRGVEVEGEKGGRLGEEGR